MKRKHVTLMIVWDEYIGQNPGGYSYSERWQIVSKQLQLGRIQLVSVHVKDTDDCTRRLGTVGFG